VIRNIPMGLLYGVCAIRLQSRQGASYCGVQQRLGSGLGKPGVAAARFLCRFIRQGGDPTLSRGERVGSQGELRTIWRDGRKMRKAPVLHS
jgi:hypothetical protein